MVLLKGDGFLFNASALVILGEEMDMIRFHKREKNKILFKKDKKIINFLKILKI
jgi:hypothetical protein